MIPPHHEIIQRSGGPVTVEHGPMENPGTFAYVFVHHDHLLCVFPVDFCLREVNYKVVTPIIG